MPDGTSQPPLANSSGHGSTRSKPTCRSPNSRPAATRAAKWSGSAASGMRGSSLERLLAKRKAVGWDVEQPIDVVEDVALGDGVAVSSAEFG